MPFEPPTSPTTPAPWQGKEDRTRRRHVLTVATAIAVIVLIAGAVALTWLLGHPRTEPSDAAPITAATTSQESRTTDDATSATSGSADPAPTTPTPTVTDGTPTFSASPTRPGQGAVAAYTSYRTDAGYGGTYDRVATLTDTTTAEFMEAVAQAYGESGAPGTAIVLEGVYSPRTGKSYRMDCVPQRDGAVICTGGVNAKVLLFN